jgi:hypothetical protein
MAILGFATSFLVFQMQSQLRQVFLGRTPTLGISWRLLLVASSQRFLQIPEPTIRINLPPVFYQK